MRHGSGILFWWPLFFTSPCPQAVVCLLYILRSKINQFRIAASLLRFPVLQNKLNLKMARHNCPIRTSLDNKATCLYFEGNDRMSVLVVLVVLKNVCGFTWCLKAIHVWFIPNYSRPPFAQFLSSPFRHMSFYLMGHINNLTSKLIWRVL